jgi:hypothetical protein
MRLRQGKWSLKFVGFQYIKTYEVENGFPPSALITDVTFRPQLDPEQYYHHEIAAALVFIISGYWKQHARENQNNIGKLLMPIGWAEVYSRLTMQGLEGFAKGFESFFVSDLSRKKLDEFVLDLNKWAPPFDETWQLPGPGRGRTVRQQTKEER